MKRLGKYPGIMAGSLLAADVGLGRWVVTYEDDCQTRCKSVAASELADTLGNGVAYLGSDRFPIYETSRNFQPPNGFEWDQSRSNRTIGR